MKDQWYNTFYIVKTREGWYRLHLTETHFCLASGGRPESMLQFIRNAVKHYRKVLKLMRTVESLDYGHPSPKTFEVYKKDYETLDHQFTEEIVQTIKESLEEVIFDTPFHRARKRRALLTTETTKDMTTKTTDAGEDKTTTTVHRGMSLLRRRPVLTT